ncbi:MAG: DNA translocase FtsK [Omnitrophica bacterium]|nr:DNA translocase FtsK [Candidatus Omnitrophota bacterium]
MEHSLANKVKALCLVAFAIFLFLSLISYHPDDTPFRSFPRNIPVKNLTGIVGAYIAEGLFVSLGWAGYLLSVLALVWALARILKKPAPKLYIKILGTVLLLLSLAVLLSLVGSPSNSEVQFQRAGLAGMIITGFLIKYFGQAGALIIALGLGILSAFVATEFLLVPLLKGTAKSLWRFILKLKQKLTPTAKMDRPAVKIEQPKFSEQPLKKERLKIIKPAPVKKPILPKAAKEREVFADYKLPTLDLLDSPPPIEERQIKDNLEASSEILESTLRDFGVEARVTQVSSGPVVTVYELEPAPGVQINRIVALSDDIALAMKAHSVRIVSIPGKSRVGVEVPNSKSTIVYLKEILESTDFQHAQSKLTLAIGKDIAGQPIVTDLADMPHLLIAGTTGSGKTVCVNSIIISLLFNASPDEIQFLMVDPKMVELAIFNDLPHLLCPVLTDHNKVSSALGWVVDEMDRRFQLLKKVGVRNIDAYNEKLKTTEEKERFQKMPYLIIIIDELADLMMVARQQVEHAITRLAQLSRAVGIHLILATQRPSVNVITGVIKANFPARISFQVASKVDSRTVLDINGADKLLGRGDLLFIRPGQHKVVRAQGSLIFDRELERIVGFIKGQKPPDYNQELLEVQQRKGRFGKKFEKDELYDEGVKVILQTKQASVSMLQRRLGLGYTRAARLIDMMEEEGVVGPYRGSKPREILIEQENIDQALQQEPENSRE